MSHNVSLKGVKIKDVTALQQAVNELMKEGVNLSLDMNAKTFRTYSGQPNRCDAAIKMGTGSHDIGLIKQPDGSYQPVYDPYAFSGDLAAKAGAENFCPLPDPKNWQAVQEHNAQAMIGKLMQRYGVCVTERAAAMQGKSVQRTTDAKTGVVELTISN